MIYEDQTILFNCSDQSSGEAVPNATWSRDGSNIPDDDGGGTLQVLVPLSWEGSTLTCHDGAGSDNVSLTLHVVSKYTITSCGGRYYNLGSGAILRGGGVCVWLC